MFGLDHGFCSWKDILEVVVVPLSVLFLGMLFPKIAESRRQAKFRAPIARELKEMAPKPAAVHKGGHWFDCLDLSSKRFLHAQIFRDASQNRDFILSLDADLAYCGAQMWHHFDQAKQVRPADDGLVARHGVDWCNYMQSVIGGFGHRGKAKKIAEVHASWTRLMLDHYPNNVRRGVEPPGSLDWFCPPQQTPQSL